MKNHRISGSFSIAPSNQASSKNSKTIMPGTLTYAFVNDVWVRAFVHECADIFGVPILSNLCVSATDRYMYTMGLMSITGAMRRMNDVWKGMHSKVEPKDAAWEFCRRFYEKYGSHVVDTSMEDDLKMLPMLAKKKLRRMRVLPTGSLK